MIDTSFPLWYNITMIKERRLIEVAKKLSISLFSTLGILCMLYYTRKFYIEGELILGKNMLVAWTIIVAMIVISLVVGTLSLWKIGKVEKQNKEMKEILLKLTENEENYYDSLCHHLQNSRELSLDIFNEMQERSG